MREDRQNFAQVLEDWFARVKRPMPWRAHPLPYVCWISEIMMQQTTYTAVLPFYKRFLKRFPTVERLASAEESDVLKAWEGLGYYARARNLLKAARQIVRSGRAIWPTTPEGWAALPGVGPYTAAALSSVLDGARVPVVDGNVARVFARIWKLTDDFGKLPARLKLAKRLQPAITHCRVPGDFNQAMMELGACVCTPKGPACDACPLAAICRARAEGKPTAYPVKRSNGDLPVRRQTAVVIRDNEGRVLLVQNRNGGLLKGLWELPTVEAGPTLTQAFSHFRQELGTFRSIRLDAAFKYPETVPLTTMTRKALKNLS